MEQMIGLGANEEGSDGIAVFCEDWDQFSGLAKMDMISDWLVILDRQFTEARREFKAEMEETRKKSMEVSKRRSRIKMVVK